MKIYTRTGDDGTTGLFGGPRVSKSEARIEAYGTVDELNAIVGLTIASLPSLVFSSPSQMTGEGAAIENGPTPSERLSRWLTSIQSTLFVLGADLATPLESKATIDRVAPELAVKLESDIDLFEEDLPSLTSFILPGGHPSASHLHVARTVCRRAERRVIELAEVDEINEECIIYLNRLSDAFFTAARWTNQAFGQAETTWNP